MPDLLVYWLTGSIAAEVTNAFTTGLLDATSRSWSRPLLERLRLPLELFPLLCEPGDMRGELTAEVLAEESRAARFTNELDVDGTVRYLRNVMGLWLLQESQRTWAAQGLPTDLDELLAAAGALPAGGPVVDCDDPRFLPPGAMPARIREVVRHEPRTAASARTAA